MENTVEVFFEDTEASRELELVDSDKKCGEEPDKFTKVNIKCENVGVANEMLTNNIGIKSETGESKEDCEYESKDNVDILKHDISIDESVDVDFLEDTGCDINSSEPSDGNILSVEISEVVNGKIEHFQYKVRLVENSETSTASDDSDGRSTFTTSPISHLPIPASSIEKQTSNLKKLNCSYQKQQVEQENDLEVINDKINSSPTLYGDPLMIPTSSIGKRRNVPKKSIHPRQKQTTKNCSRNLKPPSKKRTRTSKQSKNTNNMLSDVAVDPLDLSSYHVFPQPLNETNSNDDIGTDNVGNTDYSQQSIQPRQKQLTKSRSCSRNLKSPSKKITRTLKQCKNISNVSSDLPVDPLDLSPHCSSSQPMSETNSNDDKNIDNFNNTDSSQKSMQSKRKKMTKNKSCSKSSKPSSKKIIQALKQRKNISNVLSVLPVDPLDLSSYFSSEAGGNDNITTDNVNNIDGVANSNCNINNGCSNTDKQSCNTSQQDTANSKEPATSLNTEEKNDSFSVEELLPGKLEINLHPRDVVGISTLKTIKHIKKHKIIKSIPKKNDSVNKLPVLRVEKKPIVCNVCSKTFTRRSSLNKHLNIHNPLRDDSLTCNICGKSISCLSYLKIHQASHTSPWKCDLCGKNFNFKSYLTVHMRHHLDDKPYMCDLCGKAFTNGSCLKKHIRIHTGISPYQCQECHKSFAQKVCLDIHMANHTGFNPYLCEMCGKSFPLSSYLLKHINTEHQSSHTAPETKVKISAIIKPKKKRSASSGMESKTFLESKTTKIVRSLKRTVRCTMCKMSFKDRLLMHDHLKDYHDV